MAPSLLPGRCYRRDDQLIRLLGPVYPAMLPETEAAQWREVSEAEWNDALARAGADRVGIPTGRTDREVGSHQWAELRARRLAGGYATACAGCGVTVVGDSEAAVSMRTRELDERHFPPRGEVVIGATASEASDGAE